MVNLDDLFIPADPDLMEQERRKARELKRGAWWKGQVGEGRCHYCRKSCPPRELTMDHVIPLVRGGRTSKGNVVPACPECNRLKRNLSSEGWKAHLEALQAGDG